MGYHDRNKDGTMKQHSITTVMGGDWKDIEVQEAEHDAKVNQFNSEHVVFFNTTYEIEFYNKIKKTTICLYADGSMKQKVLPSVMPDADGLDY